MEELVKDKNLSVHQLQEKHWVVWRKTRESISLCEACGFDTIIIETVGVGQAKLPFTAWWISLLKLPERR
jgi:LAO/AO transport system kinase